MTLNAGDALYIPNGYWHAVETTEPGISVAIVVNSWCELMSYKHHDLIGQWIDTGQIRDEWSTFCVRPIDSFLDLVNRVKLILGVRSEMFDRFFQSSEWKDLFNHAHGSRVPVRKPEQQEKEESREEEEKPEEAEEELAEEEEKQGEDEESGEEEKTSGEEEEESGEEED